MDNSKYVWDIDQEDKEKLFEAAERHFSYSKRTDLLSDTLGIDNKTVYRHKENRSDAIELDTAERLANLLKNSDPRFPLEDPEEYIEKEYTYGDEEMVSVDEEVQKFLFDSFSNDEIAEISGKSKGTVPKYRRGERNIPKELYLEMFDLQKDILEGDYTVEGDIVENRPYQSKSEPIIENATPEDIKQLRKIINLRADEINLGFLKDRYKEDLDEIREIANSDIKSTFKPEGWEQSQSVKALNEIGLIEEAATGNRYRIVAEPEQFDLLEQRLGRAREELINILKEQKEQGNKITREHFDSSEDLPDSHEYEKNGHFGSWPNALWHAGIKPSKERYDKDAIIEQFLDMTHERFKVPNLTEFTEASNTPSLESINNHFDSYEELLGETGLHTRKKIQKSTDKGDKYYVEDKETLEEVLEEESEIEEDFKLLF